ncbi:acetyl-CoA carboxylase biotin carboxyl carrier protein [Polynucleobacter sp. AP-Capit-er-40B-B4]|uniref:acetyl-CoA carboxylase biotin carboxyl carrier protein n=1 Tax=Polynucleobacter sp. AP-Capit-er-40B-B4 TaxID=2576927 RepID=UPI00351DA30F|nr:acetyl-CoA carboxylase biotin carboxyl carrier protein [Polynucleobacter sp. AP-Capit-er-40B-B4]
MQTKKKVASKAKVKTKPSKKVPVKKAATKVKLPPEFTMKQVKEIVALIKDAGTFTTFGYKTEEFEIEISVGPQITSAPSTYVAPQVAMPTSVSIAAPAVAASSLSLSPSERAIKSPMIGTFYRRPSPSSDPFVEVGDSVTPTTDLCIVEVMKLLNTIPAECTGRVSRILVEDGATIEVGQPLMVIELT